MIYRLEHPLLTAIPNLDNIKASDLNVDLCQKCHAVFLTRRWHSRLPKTQSGPWQFAFKAHYQGVTYAVALWHNPSARGLPNHWLELRRMACAPDAPKFTASRMLSGMIKYFKAHCPEREKCISYQDLDVHEGIIYKAANWTPEYFSRPRRRDRSKPRVGTQRDYRSDMNTKDVAAAGKIRWAYYFNRPVDHEQIKKRMQEIEQIINDCNGETL